MVVTSVFMTTLAATSRKTEINQAALARTLKDSLHPGRNYLGCSLLLREGL